MAEVEFNKEDDYKVKIVDGGDYKEPGGGIRKPTQEEIDSYKIHRIVVMVIFALVVLVLLLVVVIMIATIDRCEAVPVEEKLPWWKSGVMYNIYPRSFMDSTGDGVGDFQGIMSKLDYIKKLGVNILYLSSVFKISPTSDYGYAVLNFKETNPDYGTMKQFEELVDTAHEKGFKVIIEFIPTDSSINHEWFKESLNASSSKRNWYIWQDDVSNGTVNERDHCWAKEKTTDQYYLYYCKNSNETGKADLNWDTIEVQNELESVLGFWLKKGVDGFRAMSVERLFNNKKSQPNNDLNKIHMTINKWHNYTRKQKADSVLIGGSFTGKSSAYYGTKSKPEFDIVINFNMVPDHQEAAKFYTAKNFQKLINEYISGVPVGKWPNWALTSFDEKRVASNVSPEMVKSLNVLLLTLPGTPIVFYGDEIGMKDVGTSNNANKAPMQWNTDKYAGFSEKATWFGEVGNGSIVNAEDDQSGIKASFEKVAKFRTDNQLSLLHGSLLNFTVIETNSVLAYTLKSDPQFITLINFSKSSQTVDVSQLCGGTKKGEISLSTSTDEGDVEMNKVKIKKECTLIIKL